MNKRLRIVIGVIIILLVLLWGYGAIVDSVTYYRGVDEVVKNSDFYESRQAWMIGDIVKGSFKRADEGYSFVMELNGSRMNVSYSGVLPPAFEEDGRVVLLGVVEDNTFVASEMQVKCPTKYTPI